MSDSRWCDLCRNGFSTRDMVDICCGTWVCDDCILREADKIKLKRERILAGAKEEEE